MMPDQAATPNETPASGKAWLLLLLISLAYMCSMLDRLVISLLVEPIKASLAISDTQISLLQGFAFLIVYALAGIPLGYLADRTNRIRLISAALVAWSLMTGLCGLATSFAALFFARAGIGMGEAALTPSAYSLIADGFPRRRLGMAISIYHIGGSMGAGISMVIGGILIGALTLNGPVTLPILGVLAPWQLTFLVLAIPGILIALFILAVPEPARRVIDPVRAGKDCAEQVNRRHLITFFKENRTLLAGHHIAVACANIALLGGTSWIAPMFKRIHGWQAAEAGVGIGIALLVASPLGLLCGGYINDKLSHRGAHMGLIVCAISMVCGAAFAAAYPLVANPYVSLGLYGTMIAFASVPLGVGAAALQRIAPADMRAIVSSVYLMVFSFVSVLGPTMIALAADKIFPTPTGIRYAIATVLPTVMILASVLYLLILPAYRRLAEKSI